MLAPDPKIVQDYLESLLTSYQSVTLASISLQQSQFFPQTPTPQWMKDLENNLSTSQTMATDWLSTKGPIVMSTVPQFFQTYSTSMQIVANKINSPGTTQENAITLLQWLKGRISSFPAESKASYDILSQFITDFEAQKSIINSALTAAQSEIKTEQSETADLTNQISQLYQDISSETVKASNGMTSVITSGASLSVAMLSFAYTVAVGGVVGPIGLIAGVVVAVGGLTIGAITNAINEQKIAENLGKIRDLQVTLLEDNQTIAILQNITIMLENVDDSLVGIKDAIDISTIWTDESEKLDDAISSLQSYTGSDFKSIPAIMSISDAAKAWNTVSKMANNVQRAVTGMDTQVIQINSPSMTVVYPK
jgi:Bacillus haemolytic enterotoxin (HBL)